MIASPASPDALSPELVLVDPGLASEARASLTSPEDSIARLGPQPIAWSEQHAREALRRLSQLADEEERNARRRPTFRVAKLTAALATWVAVAILVVDTRAWSSFL